MPLQVEVVPILCRWDWVLCARDAPQKEGLAEMVLGTASEIDVDVSPEPDAVSHGKGMQWPSNDIPYFCSSAGLAAKSSRSM